MTVSPKTMTKNSLQRLRLFIQTAFFIFVLGIFTLRHLAIGDVTGFSTVNAHGLCPFGGFETLYLLLTKQTYLTHISTSSLILSFIIVMITVVLGRFFCGWICPFGTLNVYMSALGRKYAGKNYELPKTLDRPLRYLKYIVLGVIIYFTWTLNTAVFVQYDPWVAFSYIPALPDSFFDMPVAFIILLLIMAGAMFIERFFCRYLCPLGAIQAILSKCSFTTIRKDNQSCTNCKLCLKNCPMAVEITEKEQVSSAECISCLQCVSDGCPTQKPALRLVFFDAHMKIMAYVLIGFLIFFGTYGTARAAGIWDGSACGKADASCTRKEGGCTGSH